MLERSRLQPRLATDLAICLASASLSLLSLSAWGTYPPTEFSGTTLTGIAAITICRFPVLAAFMLVLNLYEIPRFRAPFNVLRDVFLSVTVSWLGFAALGTIFGESLSLWRKVTLVGDIYSVAALWLIRVVAPQYYGRPRRKRRVLLVGAHTYAVRAFVHYAKDNADDIELVGIIDLLKGDLYFENLGIRKLGNVEQLAKAVEQHRVDTVVVLHDEPVYAAAIAELIEQPTSIEEVYVRIHIPLFIAQDIDILFVQEVPLLKVYSAKSQPTNLGRTLFDLTTASIGIILTLPLFLLMPILIRLDSPGPVFYRQRRLGIGNREFWIIKFRSMRSDAEKATGAVLAQKGDPRVTRVGKIMRATRIDEVPQLLNVMRGEMSMIGPRPERPEFQNLYLETIPWYSLRSLCKPGVTGLAQVNGDYHTSTQRKLIYDVSYVANMSPLLDLRILIATVITVLTKKGH